MADPDGPAMDGPAPGSNLQLLRFLRSLKRRWWIALLCLIIGSAGGWYHARQQIDVYRASSTLAVMPRVELRRQGTAQFAEGTQGYYDAQVQYLLSSSVIDQVFRNTDLWRPPQPERAKVSYRAAPGRSGGVITLTAEGPTPEYLQQFVRVWAQEYLNFKEQLRARAIQRAATNLLADVNITQQQADTNRARLLEFQREHNITTAQEAGSAYQARLERLIEEQNQKATQRKLFENMTKEELAQMAVARPLVSATQPGADTPDNRWQAMQPFMADQQFGKLQFEWQSRLADIKRWEGILKPAHPYLQQLQRDAVALEAQVQLQLEQIEARRIAMVESLRKEEASYQPLIDELKQQVLDSRSVQSEYNILLDEGRRLDARLADLRAQIESMAPLAREEELIDILETGRVSNKPIGPNRLALQLFGAFAGLGLGCGLIFLLQFRDDRIETNDEAETALGLPVLGRIPRQRVRKAERDRLFISNGDAHSMFAESFRSLRSAVLLGAAGQAHQVLLFTSTIPGEGKSTVALNFAATLAAGGKRVVLVEADLRRGRSYHWLGGQTENGLIQILKGQTDWESAAWATPVPGLFIIHAGGRSPHPGELLMTPAAIACIDTLRREFDHVIIDSPPLISVDDAFALIPRADAMLLVVRSRRVSARLAQDCLDEVQLRGGHILGTIINDAKLSRGHYYYHSYYQKQDTEQLRKAAKRAARKKPERKPAPVDPPRPAAPLVMLRKGRGEET